MQERLCYIKLINGEDIVATVEDVATDGEDYIIFQPLRVHFVRVPGHTGIQLGQWIPFAEQEVYPLNKRHILWIEECKDDFIQHYNEVIDYYNDGDEQSLMDQIEDQNAEAEDRMARTLLTKLSNSANNFTIH